MMEKDFTFLTVSKRSSALEAGCRGKTAFTPRSETVTLSVNDKF